MSRYNVIRSFFGLGILVLTLSFARIQLFDKTYSAQAESTMLSKSEIIPSRGLITDREGKILVRNKKQYDLFVTYNLLKEPHEMNDLYDLLGLSQEEFQNQIEKDWNNYKFSKNVPFRAMKDLPEDKVNALNEILFLFPGVEIREKIIRSYPLDVAPHVLGYISEVNKDILEEDKEYKIGDYIGVSGVEKSYEKELKGKKGASYLIKDNLGRVESKYKGGSLDEPVVPGKDLILGLDLDLQQFCEDIMKNKRGAIVAIEPETGEILSMVSAPAYDTRLLEIGSARNKVFSQISQDSLLPFFNRAIMAKYPPGSIFKPLMGLVALQEGVSNADRYIPCGGAYVYNGFSQGCHNHAPCYNIGTALAYSCNSYFFELFRNVLEQFGFENPSQGLDLFQDYLSRFGLGSPLGVDIASESPGFVPNTSFYDELYQKENVDWRSTYIMSLGIGQGEIEMSTLQMANLAAIIANRGFFFAPHIGKALVSEDNQVQKITRKKEQVNIDQVHFVPVINGMEATLNYGTGQLARVPGHTVCGKTGTSQNVHGKDHSVFFAFAPKEDPKIAIAVYVENAGFGGDIAAPIAGLAMEKYLNKEIKPYRLSLLETMKNKDLISK